MPVSAAHRALRDGTADAHERLDALFTRFDLTGRASYAAFLSAHAAATLPLERWLDAAGAERWFADWPMRRRAARLAADLAALGVELPAAVAFDAPVDPASIAGVLYVAEGSRLGGRVLARRLSPGTPHAYLDPGAGQPSWPALLARVDAVLDTPERIALAVAAASRVFARFEAEGRVRLEEVIA